MTAILEVLGHDFVGTLRLRCVRGRSPKSATNRSMIRKPIVRSSVPGQFGGDAGGCSADGQQRGAGRGGAGSSGPAVVQRYPSRAIRGASMATPFRCPAGCPGTNVGAVATVLPKYDGRRIYRNWRDRPLRPNLILLDATKFLIRLLVPSDS